MISTPEIKRIYSEIQKKILYMIPEKWDKIYLYASVIENMNSIETGEMFFYYFPKGILKKNPINVYEIPEKFNIEESLYIFLLFALYSDWNESAFSTGTERVCLLAKKTAAIAVPNILNKNTTHIFIIDSIF